MIDFDKKYSYKHCEVDTAHELLWARLSDLAGEVEACCETLDQALWVERHRRPLKRMEMSDGSVLRGEDAEYAWTAFNDNDWDSLYSENIPELLSKLGEALVDAGFDTDRQARLKGEERRKNGRDAKAS